jgi:flagellar assembly protein FliH
MKSWRETIRLDRPLRNVRVMDARDIERAIFERGRAEGERALGEQLIRQRSELLEIQRGVFAALRQAVGQVARDTEEACVQLALAAARKVVAGLPISVEAVEASVREALVDVERDNNVTVCLNAEDFSLLERLNSPLLVRDAAGERLRFEVSPEVTRGGCMVRTAFGSIDARRETKFGLLERSFSN